MFKNFRYKRTYKTLSPQEQKVCDLLETKSMTTLQLRNRGIASPSKVAYNIRKKGIIVDFDGEKYNLYK